MTSIFGDQTTFNGCNFCLWLCVFIKCLSCVLCTCGEDPSLIIRVVNFFYAAGFFNYLIYLLAGFNVETVEYKNISFTVWDVGGQDKVRSSYVL